MQIYQNDNIEGNQYKRWIGEWKIFIDTIRDKGCHQTVNFPTRLEKTLDIFATNRSSLVATCKCSDLSGLRDHGVLMIDTAVIPSTKRALRRRLVLVYMWSKGDLSSMTKELKYYTIIHHDEHSMSSSLPINTSWNNFKTTCTEALNNHMPPNLHRRDIASLGATEASRNTVDGRGGPIRKPDERTDQQTGNVITSCRRRPEGPASHRTTATLTT